MKFVVIGAGLAGLAVAYNLLEQGLGEVHLYDPKGIGGGASGAATGLLHPFPGEKTHLSIGAGSGMEETMRLIKISEEALGRYVYDDLPIVKLLVKESQRIHFHQRLQEFLSLEHIENSKKFLPELPPKEGLLIKEGYTVYISDYLEGLFIAASRLGLHFHQEGVSSLDALDCDRIFLCVGADIGRFYELPVKLVKGQALYCEGEIPHSVIGKGHITRTRWANLIQLGSTYEYDFVDDKPDVEKAQALLYPMLRSFCPDPELYPIAGGVAGIRVARKEGYLPIVARLSKRAVAVTALGSRGLLYHATSALQAIENGLSSFACQQAFSF